MAETTADVRRDIELTRERMSTTLAQLEQKLNIMQIVKDNPWPALAIAVGAGVLLSGSRADVKAAAATVTATRGASSRIGTVLDDVVSNVVSGVHEAFQERIEALVGDLKTAIGAPTTTTPRPTPTRNVGDFGASAPNAGTADWSPHTSSSDQRHGLGTESGRDVGVGFQQTPRAD
jgi:hypothetical protein